MNPRERVLTALRRQEPDRVPIDYVAADPPKYDGTTMLLTSYHIDTTYHEEQRD